VEHQTGRDRHRRGRRHRRATALELATMGADIVVAELDREGAERTAAE